MIFNDIANKILMAALLCMTLPLFLEYTIFASLVLLHVIGGEIFWTLNITLGITGLLVAVIGVSVSVWFLLKRSRIKNPSTRSLGNWVVGLSTAYAFIVLVALAVILLRLT